MKFFSLVGLLAAFYLAGCGDSEGQSEYARPSPYEVIEIEEVDGGPRYFFEAKEVTSLNQLVKFMRKNPQKKILLRPDGNIVFSQIKEVFMQVGNGGKADVTFDLSRTHKQARHATIPFATLSEKMPKDKPLPRINLQINQAGSILFNGTTFKSETYEEIQQLSTALEKQRKIRDQLIRTGSKTQKQAELIIKIKCDPLTKYQSLAGVFNACMNAGVEKFYPPLFGPLLPEEDPSLQPQSDLKKSERKPSYNSP
jgi:biopolymer transport protein ExbD